MLIVFLETPSVVHGHTTLPIPSRAEARRRNFLLGSSVITYCALPFVHSLHGVARFADAVVDDDLRLQRAAPGIEILAHFGRPIVNPFPVEPHNPDIAV